MRLREPLDHAVSKPRIQIPRTPPRGMGESPASGMRRKRSAGAGARVARAFNLLEIRGGPLSRSVRENAPGAGGFVRCSSIRGRRGECERGAGCSSRCASGTMRDARLMMEAQAGIPRPPIYPGQRCLARTSLKSWGCTFQFHGGFRCCFVARKRRNRPCARFASPVRGWGRPVNESWMNTNSMQDQLCSMPGRSCLDQIRKLLSCRVSRELTISNLRLIMCNSERDLGGRRLY